MLPSLAAAAIGLSAAAALAAAHGKVRDERSETRLEIGSRVDCTDGAFGELADVMIDPKANR
jgi:hypothetical protein